MRRFELRTPTYLHVINQFLDLGAQYMSVVL